MVKSKMLLAAKAQKRRYVNERKQLHESGSYDPLTCDCKLDKLVIASSAAPTAAIHGIPGFRFLRRYPVKQEHPGDFTPYGWVTRVAGTSSIREVVIYSDRQAKWLAPARVVVIARDSLGIRFSDVPSVFELLSDPQIIDMEIALDFPINSVIDVAFVERHAIFGKSQPRNVGKNPLYSNYGRRVGSKFVRSYAKFEIQRHRVEPSFHRRDLARFGVKDIFDFHKFSEILPRHIFFARLSRQKLKQRLRREGLSIEKQRAILREVKKLQGNVCHTLKYLRRTARLHNTRRLLVPLEDVNRVVLDAVNKWASDWAESYPTQKLTPAEAVVDWRGASEMNNLSVEVFPEASADVKSEPNSDPPSVNPLPLIDEEFLVPDEEERERCVLEAREQDEARAWEREFYDDFDVMYE